MSYKIASKITICTRDRYFDDVNESDGTREVFDRCYISLLPFSSTMINTVYEGILKEKTLRINLDK
jgi:hypothetical protein